MVEDISHGVGCLALGAGVAPTRIGMVSQFTRGLRVGVRISAVFTTSPSAKAGPG